MKTEVQAAGRVAQTANLGEGNRSQSDDIV